VIVPSLERKVAVEAAVTELATTVEVLVTSVGIVLNKEVVEAEVAAVVAAAVAEEVAEDAVVVAAEETEVDTRVIKIPGMLSVYGKGFPSC